MPPPEIQTVHNVGAEKPVRRQAGSPILLAARGGWYCEDGFFGQPLLCFYTVPSIRLAIIQALVCQLQNHVQVHLAARHGRPD